MKHYTAEELRRMLAKAGWTEKNTKNHYRYSCPCGKHWATIPGSPSDWRGLRNNIARMRRDGCTLLPKEIARQRG